MPRCSFSYGSEASICVVAPSASGTSGQPLTWGMPEMVVWAVLSAVVAGWVPGMAAWMAVQMAWETLGWLAPYSVVRGRAVSIYWAKMVYSGPPLRSWPVTAGLVG